ncbi:hypothetical protein [Streptantibioticus ferralitis]|uniref:Uncharacterized protein n=1 Tax=Streptantibioticus ferralitis TaxID=236510 RepID=A0ABT5Z1H6_9ACTN|nr:hypothetical protein [Streptantibioticus ferralitis]MDF2257654.1 hypothetical protein [Streptantibioticus ferralitis]
MTQNLIDPDHIPRFTGDLDQLESDARGLKTDGGNISKTGGDVHAKFQGLSAYYEAPEAEQLFATTKPVAEAAKTFGDSLATVSDALVEYAQTVRPIASRLEDLRHKATAFRQSIEGHPHWRSNHDRVKEHNDLWDDVNAAVAAYYDAARTATDKIEKIFGGTILIANDGSNKPNMYGYSADMLDHAKGLPWGGPVEQTYRGYDVWHWGGVFLNGFVIDGGWSLLKGLYDLTPFAGWHTFTQSWDGLGHVAIGFIARFGPNPAAATYSVANGMDPGGVSGLPTGELPQWMQDDKKVALNFAKSMVAWDEWKTNPVRAAGSTLFNGVTIAAGPLTKFGEAGEAGRFAMAAKTAAALGKAGRIIDPMTYISKGVGHVVGTLPRISDIAAAIDHFRMGDVQGLDELTKLHGVELPDGSLKFVDGSVLHTNGEWHFTDGTTIEAVNPHELAITHAGHDAPQAIDHASSHSPAPASHDMPSSADRAAFDHASDPLWDEGGAGAGHDHPGIHAASAEPRGNLPDGSWEGPNGLRLSPEANAATDHFLGRAISTEPHVTGAVQSIAHDIHHGKLNGLEFRLKGEESLKRKIATAMFEDPRLTPERALASIKDSLRYTVEIPADNYVHGVEQAVSDLHGRGFENVTFKNTWESSGYKGINSTWRDPATGQIFEVQFHTPESFAAKMDSHGLYERERLPGVSPEELTSIRAEKQEVFGRVPVPHDAGYIHLEHPDRGPEGSTGHAGNPAPRGHDGGFGLRHEHTDASSGGHSSGDDHGTHAGHTGAEHHDGSAAHAVHDSGNAVADGLENRGTPTPTPQTHSLGHGHPGFSIMDKGDRFYTSFLKAKPLEGHYDVVAHGTMHNTIMDTAGGRELSPRELADVIRRRADYEPGTPIRLISCNTGHLDGTFAGQLARDLGVPVVAPDGYAYVDAYGRLGVERELNLLPRHIPGLRGSFYRYYPGGYVEELPRSKWAVDQ